MIMKILTILTLCYLNLNAQIYNIEKHWNLLGATETFNVDVFKESCVDNVFLYSGDNKWISYPKEVSSKNINIGMGFWVYASQDCVIDTKNANTKDNIENKSPNILLIIADDIGLDSSLGYDIGSIKPKMKNIQNLINNGITFNNVWASSLCTPTRSNIITGKYASKTNTLNVGSELSTNEISLQKYINTKSPSKYETAVIGKWHLSNKETHPKNMGVGYYAGLLSGGVRDYSRWKLTQDEKTSFSKEYITTKFTDLAINWVSSKKNPWFLWLAYTSAHTPFHLPPKNLHSQNLEGGVIDIEENPRKYYMTMIEAMDSEIGRLISSIPKKDLENTIIIFIGDNGTPNEVRQGYGDKKVKGTIYEGGIHIPMIISGAKVSRKNEKENALINITDLYSTIAKLSGIDVETINNSQSFFKLLNDKNAKTRKYIYAESSKKSGKIDFAIRDNKYKYISFGNKQEAFYDLSDNLLETKNLINSLTKEQIKIKNELLKEALKIQK